MTFTIKEKYNITDLLELMKVLRSDEGCPWDREQTHESIKDNMLEEANEAVAAIDNKDTDNLKEELGDVLLQVIFHSRISEENGGFDFGDVVDGLCHKLVSRHTHVFGDNKANSPEEAIDSWKRAKEKEKQG